MSTDAMRLLVTGGTGMVGKAIQEQIGSDNAVFVGSKNFDLTNSEQVKDMFKWNQPTHVIHLAAKVGGVKANMKANGDFFALNQQMNANVLRTAYETESCVRLVSLLSTCVYPDSAHVTYPLTENQLHAGPPHSSNFGYAFSKRMLEVQSRAYNEQDGNKKFLCAIPCNVYGKHDNFDLEDGHVVPALIRKIHEANLAGFKEVNLWGTGEPVREFTYAADIARDLISLVGLKDPVHATYNIGHTMESTSIRVLAEKIMSALGSDLLELKWDVNSPNGQMKKPSNTDRYMSEFPRNTYTTLDDGLKETCVWFLENYPNVRGVRK